MPGERGEKGETGERGADGLGFEHMEEELAEDGRTLVRRYRRGEEVKEFRHRVPTVIDRGVYKAGTTYQPGDGVTWAGSFWIAQAETSSKPDSGEGWRLAVKRGRDGRDGKDGAPGPQGKEGPRGRDLTQMGPDGSKW
ncbi:hypothetical protein Mnod_4075 [Methylobacterium nodulans ORS 2060]|uniref:Collagen triple helix repeat protein n=2 Tax=Methylobacterium nodulans TaxID=114616 RepID=B8ITN8_METNO|nr:hypothetical protein Mnod_4075 [Methylobacterium nodulans ORS 2060]